MAKSIWHKNERCCRPTDLFCVFQPIFSFFFFFFFLLLHNRITQSNAAFLFFCKHCWRQGFIVWMNFIGIVNGHSLSGFHVYIQCESPRRGQSIGSYNASIKSFWMSRKANLMWVNTRYNIKAKTASAPLNVCSVTYTFLKLK